VPDIHEDTSPEVALPMGREIEAFYPSARAIATRALAGPILLLAGLAVCVVGMLSRPALIEPGWFVAVFAACVLPLSLRGIRAFVGISLLRLCVHEHGFVLRSAEGTRAVLWEAVREMGVVEGRAGVVTLGVYHDSWRADRHRGRRGRAPRRGGVFPVAGCREIFCVTVERFRTGKSRDKR
jgi:hypothetical protein